MKVQFTKDCFMDGAIRPAGSKYKLPERVKFSPKCMIEIKGKEAEQEEDTEQEQEPEEKAIDTGPTRKELMAQLDAAGVKYKPVGNKAYLQGLLDSIKPAGTSQAPSKEEEIPY